MQRLDRRLFLSLTGATGAAMLARPALAAPQSAEVFTADDAGALVDSVILIGAQKALLVDAQINVASATALAAMIAATGRTLETIFITHHHPDHVLGLETLLARFPQARVLAHRDIVPVIAGSAQGYLDFLTGTAPAGTFAGSVVIPGALEADHLLLEGERIEVLPPMHGDTALMTALHVPTLDMLIATDFAYDGTHVWVAENTDPADIAKWRDSLTVLEAIGAGTVVPGHRGSVPSGDVFAATRAYLDQWEAALATTTTKDDLRAAMMAGNDALGLNFALDSAVAAVFPG